MHQRNGGTGSKSHSYNMVLRLDPCVFVLRKSGKVHGVLGVHVHDMICGGNETFNRFMTAVRKEFDFGSWDSGNFRFKGRQICQMPNGEIVFEMKQFNHELEQIEVSKADKTNYDAIHKEGAAPASKDKRLAMELAISEAKAVSGETDLRWIDARYQIADCLTKHASRKSEAVCRKFSMRLSGELRQKWTCWTSANKKEKIVTIRLAAKRYLMLRLW